MRIKPNVTNAKKKKKSKPLLPPKSNGTHVFLHLFLCKACKQLPGFGGHNYEGVDI